MKKQTKKTPPKKTPLKSRFAVRQQDTPPEALTNESLLTRQEAAKYAGCSVRTIATWIKDRGLPEMKQQRYSRIRKGDLDQFLAGQSMVSAPVKSAGELNPTTGDTLKEIRKMCEREKVKRKLLGLDPVVGLDPRFGLDYEGSIRRFLKENINKNPGPG